VARPARAAERVAAVVVDYDTAELLGPCVASLAAEGVSATVVVENAPGARPGAALEAAGVPVPVLEPGRNLGYGAGANRGVASLVGPEYVLVCNPDLVVHPGAVAALAGALDEEPAWALVGPAIVDPGGRPYPSARCFPSMADAAGHALIGLFRPDNRFSNRYRAPDPTAGGRRPVDWVSGACLMVRRSAFEELGGFDESYFMFAEEMDLCWRAGQAGWAVGFEPEAVVTHVEGVSRRRHPYRMILAHHRSAWRFAVRTTTGGRRVALPLAAAVLSLRLGLALLRQATRSRAAARR
jgi:N-acetylglucosaminyl-diphospho-decaprenol L-rhamnosyltransferase